MLRCHVDESVNMKGGDKGNYRFHYGLHLCELAVVPASTHMQEIRASIEGENHEDKKDCCQPELAAGDAGGA